MQHFDNGLFCFEVLITPISHSCFESRTNKKLVFFCCILCVWFGYKPSIIFLLNRQLLPSQNQPLVILVLTQFITELPFSALG